MPGGTLSLPGGKQRSTASCPAVAPPACRDHVLPCCVGPILQTDTCTAAGAPAGARDPDRCCYMSGVKDQKPTLFERVDLNVKTHQRLTPGRDPLWHLVLKRTTYDLQSGKILSCHHWRNERGPNSLPSKEDLRILDQALPHGGHGQDIRTVFRLRRPLTADEIDKFGRHGSPSSMQCG